MKPKVYIFDFDGTLVHSNKIKREAFYNLSDEIIKNRQVVDKVLSAIPELSRFEIIEKIHEKISDNSGLTFERKVILKAIDRYSEVVRERVLACPEVDGASELLTTLNAEGHLIFISSNTPERPLGQLIAARKWNKLIHGYYGYPKQKHETIQRILTDRQLQPSEVLVIGDGTSDESSALQTGCHFFKVKSGNSLRELYTFLYNQ
jgi:phosphoglycolate phosphatase